MQVTRPVLIAAATAFAALLATVFFLLGRESVRRRPAPALAPPAMAGEPAAVAMAAPAPLPTVASPPSPSPALPVVAAPPPPPLPTATSAPVPAAPAQPPVQPPIRMNITSAPVPSAPSASNDEAAAVRDYFLRVQAIQATAPSTDTNEFANKLLASSMTGDMSGLDELVRVTEEGQRHVQELTPPEPCVSYHARLLNVLGESASMVKQLRTALTTKDARALASMQASGASLQASANALDQQAREIKAEYGVSR